MDLNVFRVAIIFTVQTKSQKEAKIFVLSLHHAQTFHTQPNVCKTKGQKKYDACSTFDNTPYTDPN